MAVSMATRLGVVATRLQPGEVQDQVRADAEGACRRGADRRVGHGREMVGSRSPAWDRLRGPHHRCLRCDESFEGAGHSGRGNLGPGICGQHRPNGHGGRRDGRHFPDRSPPSKRPVRNGPSRSRRRSPSDASGARRSWQRSPRPIEDSPRPRRWVAGWTTSPTPGSHRAPPGSSSSDARTANQPASMSSWRRSALRWPARSSAPRPGTCGPGRSRKRRHDSDRARSPAAQR